MTYAIRGGIHLCEAGTREAGVVAERTRVNEVLHKISVRQRTLRDATHDSILDEILQKVNNARLP